MAEIITEAMSAGLWSDSSQIDMLAQGRTRGPAGPMRSPLIKIVTTMVRSIGVNMEDAIFWHAITAVKSALRELSLDSIVIHTFTSTMNQDQ